MAEPTVLTDDDIKTTWTRGATDAAVMEADPDSTDSDGTDGDSTDTTDGDSGGGSDADGTDS